MGQVLQDVLRNFSGGVITSRAADELDNNESPRGRNSALTLIGGQKALVGKRRGASVASAAPFDFGGSTAAAIIGQYLFRKFSTSGEYIPYHLVVGDGGQISVMNANGDEAILGFDGDIGNPFTAGTHFPDFATSNNLCFIVNASGDRVKFRGTPTNDFQDLQHFGITRPGSTNFSAFAITDSGTLGVHNGTYEARFTYKNSVTGHESSASDSSASVTVTNKQLSWSFTITGVDRQIDTLRLYLRNTSTMANFYLAGEVTVALPSGSPITATTNVSDAALVTLAPDQAENEPPPANLKYLATHLSRLFGSDGVSLFYSKVGLPEAWDPDNTELINANDSDQITAIHAAHEVLIVFKRTQMYALFGDDPDSWSIRQITADIGCISHRTVRTVEGITYWWSLKGPMAWDGVGLPKPIGLPLIQPTVSTEALNYSVLGNACAEVDAQNQRIMFALPSITSTSRNDIILPFNYRIGVWESDRWDPFDVCSMAVVEDSNKVPWVMIGSYSGEIFKWWNAFSDALPHVPPTTTPDYTFNGVITNNTNTTIVDATANFPNGGGPLISSTAFLDRYVYIQSTPVQRLRIISSNGTTLTIDSAVPITPVTEVAQQGSCTGLTYYIGGPNFSWDTPWMDGSQPFYKKRYEYLYVQAFSETTGSNVSVGVDLFLDGDPYTAARTFTYLTGAIGAVWDTSLWDGTDVWGYPRTVQSRLRCAKTGRAWRARFRNGLPDQALTLTKIGMRGELLTDKS